MLTALPGRDGFLLCSGDCQDRGRRARAPHVGPGVGLVQQKLILGNSCRFCNAARRHCAALRAAIRQPRACPPGIGRHRPGNAWFAGSNALKGGVIVYWRGSVISALQASCARRPTCSHGFRLRPRLRRTGRLGPTNPSLSGSAIGSAAARMCGIAIRVSCYPQLNQPQVSRLVGESRLRCELT